MTKISVLERERICGLYATGKMSQEKLARKYGVTHTTIRNIILGKWPHYNYFWNETVGEKKLRQYAEHYEQKAKEYRNKYDIAVNNRLQKELLL